MASSYSCPLFEISVRCGLNGFRDFCKEIGNIEGLDYQNMYEQYKCAVKSMKRTYRKPWPATVQLIRQFISQPQPSINLMTMAPAHASTNQEHTGTQAPVDTPIAPLSGAPDPPASFSTQGLHTTRPATVPVAQNQGSSVRRSQPDQATNPAMESMAKTSAPIANLGSQRLSNSVTGSSFQRLEHVDIRRGCLSARMRELLKGSVEDTTPRTNAGAVGEGRPCPPFNNNQRSR